MTEFPPLQCSSAFVPWLIQAAAERDVEIGASLLECVKNVQKPAKKQKGLNWLMNKLNSNNTKTYDLLQLLAINALEFTAPASAAFFVNKEEEENKRTFVQLSGHRGSFAPAGPNSIWKKQPAGSSECEIYTEITASSTETKLQRIIPKYYSKIEWHNDVFLEMEDLLMNFNSESGLAVMDLKIGKRTFLESEVSNLKERNDLFIKMIEIDPTAPTAEEREKEAVTKLRYMQFREQLSSTNEIGFRIEAIKFLDKTELLDTSELKRTKTESDVKKLISKFLQPIKIEEKEAVCNRLEEIRTTLEMSDFFKDHEMIGSSILLIYDGEGRTGAWMIDFAKTLKSPHTLNHRSEWKMGNHEDGFLTGLDNLIRIIQNVI